MAAYPEGWDVTAEKITEAVHRIVAAADPIQIIAFGSRARGDHRPDSDLDLAVILDDPQETAYDRVNDDLFVGIDMMTDLITVSRSTYDLYRPCINSVYHHIDVEGFLLYERDDPRFRYANAIQAGARGLVSPAVRAA